MATKPKKKTLRIRKGTIRKKILLVTHTGPDLDAAVGEFLKLIALGFKRLDDPRFVTCFAFVPPGKRVKKKTIDEINPNIVSHLDTGTRCNPATHDHDHHPANPDIEPEFHSTAALLQATYPKELAQYPWLDNLIYFTDCKDSGRPAETRDDYAREMRPGLNKILEENNVTGLRIVDDLEEFRGWLRIFSNLLCSDEDKMRTALNWLFGWHEKNRPKTERFELVAQSDLVKTATGLRLRVLPPTDIERKHVRNHFQLNREYDLDGFLSLTSPAGRSTIGINCVNKNVRPSMDVLFQALIAKYKATLNVEKKFEFVFQGKKVELFLHGERFVMYLHMDSGQSAEALYLEVQQLAFETLRRQSVAVA